MYLSLFIFLLHALGAVAHVEDAHIAKRAVTYAGVCTYYTSVQVLTTSVYSSTCTSAAVSGPFVTLACSSGLLIIGTQCSTAVTATSCSSSAALTTTSTAFLGPTTTITVTSSTCSNAVYAPTPLQTAPGTTCYADNVNGLGRVLSGAAFTSTTSMTNTLCQNYCNNLNYAYSGTEYGQECYCGNTIPTVLSSSCNMACSLPGSTIICGGPNALSVSTNTVVLSAYSSATALLASYTSKGCYGDNYPSRVLTAASTTATTMSQETCVVFCNSGGYSLAGVENGQECYCANSIRTDNTNYGIPVSSGCTYTCSGKSSEICGGSNVLNLYSRTSTIAVAAAPMPLPATASGYLLLGCYTDNPANRTLSVSKSTVTSVEACVSACSAAAFAYAGVEFRAECWCDSAIRGGATSSTNCVYQCSGTPSEICGGVNAIQIYMGTPGTGVTIPSPAGGYTYQGTYPDSVSSRTLSNQQMLSSNTVVNCVLTCSNLGFAYAGLETGTQCFCGSSILNGATAGQSPNTPCSGNSAQFCGGPNLIQIYKGTPSPQNVTTSSFTNGGCVADNNNNVRTLPVPITSSNSMTPASCKASCVGYTYYGVEYGQECWCGNTFAAGTVVSYSCSYACTGDSTQICGGSNALNMYNS